MEIPNDFCICCLEQNGLVNLSSCKHRNFLMDQIKVKMQQKQFVCLMCHRLLKKFEEFKQRVNETQLILQKAYVDGNTVSLHRNLNFAEIQILSTTDCETTTGDTQNSSDVIAYRNALNYRVFKEEQVVIKVEDIDIKEEDIAPLSETKRSMEGSVHSDGVKATRGHIAESETSKYNQKASVNGNTVSEHLNENLGELNIPSRADSTISTAETINANDSLRELSEHIDLDIEFESVKLESDTPHAVEIGETTKRCVDKRNNTSAEEKETTKTEGIKCNEKKPVEEKIRVVTLSSKEIAEERELEANVEKYLKLPYKCTSCILGFEYELSLKYHLEKRHTKKNDNFVCDICTSVLGNIDSYRNHVRRHAKRYECLVCGQRSKSMCVALLHHSRAHEKITMEYICKECGFITDSHRRYRYHREKHKQKPNCEECGRNFVNASGLRVHMYRVHKQSPREHRCDSCSKVYNSKSTLVAHMKSNHGDTTRPYCAKCRTYYKSEQSYRQHMKTSSNHVSEDDKKFACNECGLKFFSMSKQKEHYNYIHLKNSKFKCEKCKKIFKKNSDLNKHKEFVHNKKPRPRNMICDHCGRAFHTMTILRSHIRTHTGERPFHCAHCPATFAQSAAKYTHTRLLHAAT